MVINSISKNEGKWAGWSRFKEKEISLDKRGRVGI